ncbi:siderophore ABC transporter substrate-binding protein [Egibacter rhizosphaerae]|uniref:Siderophore ABC transporter substrate-binding protein n=1 Tax=Egibacter rhizosphaerae TaxID=1670831 RepID=A0A411YLA4_9ACTN|nr:siderophore ABC transporter substrate-binding protein [Egibacter rhizosphaerae]
MTVEHVQGETTVETEPEVVVTFDVGTLDTLDAMGVPVAGVPEVANVPAHLEEYAGGETSIVGSLFEPDPEEVNALDPDLIIVGGRSSEAFGELSELAPTVDLTVDNTDFLNSFGEQLGVLGEIFDREEWVEERLAVLDERVGEVSALADDAGDGLIVMTSGGEVTAYGPGSRFGLIHKDLGVAPAVEDVEEATHGDAVSFEFILEAEPDHLFVLDRDAAIGETGEAAEAVLDNELVAQTPAWENGDVHYLDEVVWYLVPTGLRSVETMVDEIDAALR